MSLTSIRPFKLPSQGWARLTLVIVLAIAAALLAKLLLAGFDSGRRAPSGRSSELSMYADDQGERILLSWSRNNPIVLASAGGVLRISDGGHSRDVPLDSAVIASGSVLYRPASNNVSFQLDVRSQRGEHATGKLMMLDGVSTSPDVAGNTVNSANSRPPVLATIVSVSVPQPRVRPMKESPVQEARLIAPEIPLPASTGGDESAINPTLTSAPAVPESKPENADVHFIAQFSSPPAATQNPLPAPAASPDAPPPADTAPDASSVSAPVAIPSSIDIAATFVPAKPLRQVMPDIKQFGMAKNISGQLEVDVDVKVNDKGRVMQASLIGNTAGIPGYISFAALNAARQWIFQPATLRGKVIPSDHHLVFKFAPGQK